MVHPVVDISYAALEEHRIVNITLYQEYSPCIIFIFSQGGSTSIMSKINTRSNSS
jgi:hypothetical protein